MRKKSIRTVSGSGVSGEAGSSSSILVSKRAIAALICLIMPPWILAAVFFFSIRSSEPSAGPAETDVGPPPAGGAYFGSIGPWGQLEYAPIIIAPPLEYVPDSPDRLQLENRWFFPNISVEELRAFFQTTGLSQADCEQLMASVRQVPEYQTLVVLPTDSLVRNLSPDTRAAIYSILAFSPLNDIQQNAFRFYGGRLGEWIGTARLPEEVIQLIDPFIYRQGGFMYFCDVDQVIPRIPDLSARRKLIKALFRENTLLVKLRIPRGADVQDIANYWGRGGRTTDIQPLLESVVAVSADYTIDISHLLPVFVRRRAYRYPRITMSDLENSQLQNCFWTALNFFNDTPDDRFLDQRKVSETLKNDYVVVYDQFQLGDLVLFSDENGNHYHAANYLADGLVFTKNGNSTLAPWSFLPLERIKGYYPQHAERGKIEVYRHKSM